MFKIYTTRHNFNVYDATIVSQRERNALTCFNEKVQFKNVKMEPFSIRLPAFASPPILAIVTNTTNLTILRWQPLTVHKDYMAFEAKNEILVASWKEVATPYFIFPKMNLPLVRIRILCTN